MPEGRHGHHTDPFAVAAFVISLLSAGVAIVHFVDYSEVELLPLEQVVIVLDDRRPDRQQTIVAPEVAIFNRASGNYSDAIRNVTFTIGTDAGAQFCFEDLAYAHLHIDGVAIGARLSQAAVMPARTDQAATPRAAHDEPCEEVECIRQGLGGEFLLVTLEDAVPQTLNAGSVFSRRIAFKPRPCSEGAPVPSYQEMLDAMLDHTLTFEVTVETLKDGPHAARCTLAFSRRAYDFAARERFFTQSCTPGAAREATAVDRLRAWLDSLL